MLHVILRLRVPQREVLAVLVLQERFVRAALDDAAWSNTAMLSQKRQEEGGG